MVNSWVTRKAMRKKGKNKRRGGEDYCTVDNVGSGERVKWEVGRREVRLIETRVSWTVQDEGKIRPENQRVVRSSIRLLTSIAANGPNKRKMYNPTRHVNPIVLVISSISSPRVEAIERCWVAWGGM